MRTASLAMILVSAALVAKGQQLVDLEEDDVEEPFESVNVTGNFHFEPAGLKMNFLLIK